MGKHYKTKMNSSFLYNNLPKTFIRFLKHTKQLRPFIKYVNENNNLFRITSILQKYLYDNEYDTTYSLLNTLIKLLFSKYLFRTNGGVSIILFP